MRDPRGVAIFLGCYDRPRMPGKLSATYELPTRDIGVIEPGPFTTQIKGPRPATATLKSSRRGFTLIIEIDTDDPTSASDIADSYAAQLAEHLTLWFCDRVKKAVVARRTHRQFQGTDADTLHAFPGAVAFVGHAMKVRITVIPKAKTLQDALSDFSMRLAARPPVFAGDVVVARQMYFAALKVENRASRFLIIYTALAVFSTFKLGTRGGTQDRIDHILTTGDPTLPMTTPPGRTRAETEFTKARNDFLHAEERGRTPASALATLEGLTPRLQSLAGRILLRGKPITLLRAGVAPMVSRGPQLARAFGGRGDRWRRRLGRADARSSLLDQPHATTRSRGSFPTSRCPIRNSRW